MSFVVYPDRNPASRMHALMHAWADLSGYQCRTPIRKSMPVLMSSVVYPDRNPAMRLFAIVAAVWGLSNKGAP